MQPVRVRLSWKKGGKLPANTAPEARPGRWGKPFSGGPCHVEVLPDIANC